MLELKEQIKEFKQNESCNIKKNENIQTMNCWDFWKYNSKVRNSCPAYTNNSGKKCWTVVAGKCSRSKVKGLEDYKACLWYEKINSGTTDDITL